MNFSMHLDFFTTIEFFYAPQVCFMNNFFTLPEMQLSLEIPTMLDYHFPVW